MLNLSAILRFLRNRADAQFDRTHGIDTCGLVNPGFAGMPEAVKRDGLYYVPIGTGRLKRLVRASRIDPSRYHFVDLGSGKGRALIVASRYPFKSIVGIEADHGLSEIARANAASWRRTHPSAPLRVVEGDARTAELPDGHLFVLLANSFTGEVLEIVCNRLAALAATPQREVVVAYSGDEHAGVLAATGAFRREAIRPIRRWLRPSSSLFFNPLADAKRLW